MTYLAFSAEDRSQSAEAYRKEVAPVIRAQKGNKDASLLEPADGGDEYISSTLWEDEAALKSFEASAAYSDLIARIKQMVSKPPQQKYYKVSR